PPHRDQPSHRSPARLFRRAEYGKSFGQLASALAMSDPHPGQSKTIIVTGASSGIGAHCARALKRDGWTVFATARKPGDIEQLKSDGIEAFYLDYREPDSIAAL